MDIELVPLCTIEASLSPQPIVVGNGPSGMRVIFEVGAGKVEGERLRGQVRGSGGADWALLHGDTGTIDVRMTLDTHDGAIVYVQYHGKVSIRTDPIRMRIAPRFETGDERYSWLNSVQAIGVGESDGTNIRYEWYEVR
jgi:Protein of unknown function (DUF3237)